MIMKKLDVHFAKEIVISFSRIQDFKIKVFFITKIHLIVMKMYLLTQMNGQMMELLQYQHYHLQKMEVWLYLVFQKKVQIGNQVY